MTNSQQLYLKYQGLSEEKNIKIFRCFLLNYVEGSAVTRKTWQWKDFKKEYFVKIIIGNVSSESGKNAQKKSRCIVRWNPELKCAKSRLNFLLNDDLKSAAVQWQFSKKKIPIRFVKIQIWVSLKSGFDLFRDTDLNFVQIVIWNVQRCSDRARRV